MKRIDLTDDQHATLAGILRERAEARGADRAQLVAEGAARGLIEMADAAITSLAELVVACEVAQDVDARDSMASTLARLSGAGSINQEAEAMLRAALGVGPVDPDDELVMKAALAEAAGQPRPPLIIPVRERTSQVLPTICGGCGVVLDACVCDQSRIGDRLSRTRRDESSAARGLRLPRNEHERKIYDCLRRGPSHGGQLDEYQRAWRDYQNAVIVDESGATGTQRSDWGERGEGDEQP